MCSLQVNTGTWRSYYNQMLIWPIADPEWEITTGNSVSWSGEIYCRETDMVGTESDSCRISQCKYKTFNNVFVSSNLSTYSDQIGSSDLNEWGVKLIDGSTIDVWDKNPLP